MWHSNLQGDTMSWYLIKKTLDTWVFAIVLYWQSLIAHQPVLFRTFFSKSSHSLAIWTRDKVSELMILIESELDCMSSVPLDGMGDINRDVGESSSPDVCLTLWGHSVMLLSSPAPAVPNTAQIISTGSYSTHTSSTTVRSYTFE